MIVRMMIMVRMMMIGVKIIYNIASIPPQSSALSPPMEKSDLLATARVAIFQPLVSSLVGISSVVPGKH